MKREDVLANLKSLIGKRFDKDEVVKAFEGFTENGEKEVYVSSTGRADYTASISTADGTNFEIEVDEDEIIVDVELELASADEKKIELTSSDVSEEAYNLYADSDIVITKKGYAYLIYESGRRSPDAQPTMELESMEEVDRYLTAIANGEEYYA